MSYIFTFEQVIGHIPWGLLLRATTAFLLIQVSWQLAISRRPFIQERWQTSVFWSTSAFGVAVTSWGALANISVSPIWWVIGFLALLAAGLTPMLAWLHFVWERTIFGVVLCLVFFGLFEAVIAGIEEPVFFVILASTLTGFCCGNAVATTAIVIGYRSPPKVPSEFLDGSNNVPRI